mmetsp:Transcript_12315/g.43408  ORF Transcript_12315/g.43408 Transcript_12315/m.43408 type:complete len:625 (+) Transcript_12315:47-1921(+)
MIQSLAWLALLTLWTVFGQELAPRASWPAEVEAYRALLRSRSKDVEGWAAAARELRKFMIEHDPDYPVYHHAAPEGWINDPNGITWDPSTGLYHTFYQYTRTYDESCMHGNTTNCSAYSPEGKKYNAMVWGHIVSRDLVVWRDWPGVEADSEWDALGVFSGNCVLRDHAGIVCIYSGFKRVPCDTGVCAYSSDWVHWEKRGCIPQAPNPRAPDPAKQANHDTAIFKDGDSWFILSGGCTFDGGNVPKPGLKCEGNAQLWESADLINFTYVSPLVPGGPGWFWELPYLLPFDASGNAIDNYHMRDGEQFALMFGELFGSDHSNSYWVGSYNHTTKRFVPFGANDSNSSQWPKPRLLDDHAVYYSFNPHATDLSGPNGSARRLMFGWLSGDLSPAVLARTVPYWQSTFSLLRTITIQGDAIVQLPTPEVEALRSSRLANNGSMTVLPGVAQPLPGVQGDVLELWARFSLRTKASSFGLEWRRMGGRTCRIIYSVEARTIRVEGGAAIPVDLVQQTAPDVLELRLFLDRSVIEVYSGGAAVSGRCISHPDLAVRRSVARPEVAAFVDADRVDLSFDSWDMRSMWGIEVEPEETSTATPPVGIASPTTKTSPTAMAGGADDVLREVEV